MERKVESVEVKVWSVECGVWIGGVLRGRAPPAKP